MFRQSSEEVFSTNHYQLSVDWFGIIRSYRTQTLPSNRGYDLMRFEMVNDEFIQKLRELNRVRNSFSHSGAISDQQARELFATYRDKIVAILQKVTDLSSIMFIRYTGPGRVPLEYCFDEFIGHATTRRYNFL